MNFDKRIPIYNQLIDKFKYAFVRGEYQLGEALPSRREVAQMYVVNPNTVQKAFKEMEELGLIITEPNVPSRVTDDPKKIEELKRELIKSSVEEFYHQIESMNLDINDVVELLIKYDSEQREENHD